MIQHSIYDKLATGAEWQGVGVYLHSFSPFSDPLVHVKAVNGH